MQDPWLGEELVGQFGHTLPHQPHSLAVLEEHVYASSEDLIADLGERIIAPAEVKVRELRGAGWTLMLPRASYPAFRGDGRFCA